jgi:peptide/nickel transport system permease protein
MLKYILKRIAVFIPTLFVISFIAFAISINSPGDPVEILYSGSNGESQTAQGSTVQLAKKQLRHQLGLDLPVFYITLTNFASPDTLYRIENPRDRETLSRLVSMYGNWAEISTWYHSLQDFKIRMAGVKPDSVAYSVLGTATADQHVDDAVQEINSLFLSYEEVVISSKLSKLQKMMEGEKSLGRHSALVMLDEPLVECTHAFQNMIGNGTKWKTWIPALHFYGYNQYHRWLFGDGNWLTGNGSQFTKGVIRGDFGVSYSTKLPVSEIIAHSLPWSLFFTLLSVILAYAVSIPVGVKSAASRGGIFDRTSSVVLFMLYSLPSFFVATLLLMLFANPHVYNIFPANGIRPAAGYPDGISFLEKCRISFPYIVLPLITYTYSSFAFLSRTMRVSMLEVLGNDYIRTAKAKGLSHFKVIYKHGLKNALLPIITIFSTIFPVAVGGSVIIEVIFGIPGMGQEIYQAIGMKDYTLIVAVFTLSGFMTLVGYLIADILYAVVDPRISYTK